MAGASSLTILLAQAEAQINQTPRGVDHRTSPDWRELLWELLWGFCIPGSIPQSHRPITILPCLAWVLLVVGILQAGCRRSCPCGGCPGGFWGVLGGVWGLRRLQASLLLHRRNWGDKRVGRSHQQRSLQRVLAGAWLQEPCMETAHGQLSLQAVLAVPNDGVAF